MPEIVIAWEIERVGGGERVRHLSSHTGLMQVLPRVLAQDIPVRPVSGRGGLEAPDLLGGGIGGDTAAVLPGLKLGTLFFFLALMWTTHMSGSYHLIIQAGWNSCNILC